MVAIKQVENQRVPEAPVLNICIILETEYNLFSFGLCLMYD